MSPPQLRGHVSTGGHRGPAGALGALRPLQAERERAGCGAVPRPQPVSNRWPSLRCRVIRAAAPHAPPGQHAAPAHRGSGRPGPRPPPGTLSRPTRPGPFLPGSNQAPTWAGQRTPGRLSRTCRRGSTRRTRTRDTRSRYSGYSEDTTADNVSSPKPGSRRDYGEDTRKWA